MARKEAKKKARVPFDEDSMSTTTLYKNYKQNTDEETQKEKREKRQKKKRKCLSRILHFL
jgi:hypothetical protein